MGHGEFQGDAVEPHAAWAARELHRGCLRPDLQRTRGCGRRRKRVAIQRDPAGERDRELRESGSAHPGADQSRCGAERGPSASPGYVGRSEGFSVLTMPEPEIWKPKYN